MTIPLYFYRPVLVTDTSSNGGRMSYNQAVLTRGGAGNFPLLTQAEQLAGVTKHRKLFAAVRDATNPVLSKATVFLKAPSLLADTRSYLIAGTQRDQQGAIGTRKYATGLLHANVSAGATVLVVDFEAGSGVDLVVQAGDKIAVIEGATENLDLYVASVSWATDQAIITLTTGVLNAFTTSAAVAACILDTANINCVVDNVVKSFSASTYNESLIETNNLGTDEQTMTVTFTSTTAFSVLSDRYGALSSGSVASDYEPINPESTTPYFSLPASGWGGTHTIGEVMQFQTHPAAVPFWVVHKTNASADVTLDTVYPSVRFEG